MPRIEPPRHGWIWVGGALGHHPLCVSRSLRTALMETPNAYRPVMQVEEEGYTEQWTFQFVDGDEDYMRFTTTIQTGDETYVLYIERLAIESEGEK